MKLAEIRNAYIQEGMSYLNATSRTAQDVVLALIADSPLSQNVTIKGGVVMQHLSGDDRRATRDLDFDFIKYPIGNDAIRSFIEKLNGHSGDLSIEITTPIEELKQRDYSGKRVYIRITDTAGTVIDTKLDIGVHKHLNMEQQDFCFDLGKLDDSVTLLANTMEQIFAEKLKSLLRLGAISSRYKDLFDMYYLATQEKLDKDKLTEDLKTLVYDDTTMRENDFDAIISRLDVVLHDPRFLMPLGRSKTTNWIGVAPETATRGLLDYLKTFAQTRVP